MPIFSRREIEALLDQLLKFSGAVDASDETSGIVTLPVLHNVAHQPSADPVRATKSAAVCYSRRRLMIEGGNEPDFDPMMDFRLPH
jgi:hypothetical protein